MFPKHRKCLHWHGNNLDNFDTWNYNLDNTFGIPVIPSVFGKIKDEYAEKIVLKFYGAGEKAHTVITEDRCTKKA